LLSQAAVAYQLLKGAGEIRSGDPDSGAETIVWEVGALHDAATFVGDATQARAKQKVKEMRRNDGQIGGEGRRRGENAADDEYIENNE
jgi:hypothetical protein